MMELQQIVDQLQLNQHRDSIKRCYYTVWKLFNEFFIKLDQKPRTWEDRLTLFVGYLIDNDRQSATVKSYISVIKAVLKSHKIQLKGDTYLVISLTHACRLKNDQLRARLPIQKGMLVLILHEVNSHYLSIGQPFLALLYRTLLSTAYFGLFRVSELTTGSHPVLAKNVHIGHNKKKMLFLLRTSKTHCQNAQPQLIKISALQHKHASPIIESDYLHFPCPFELLYNYASVRGGYYSDSEPFFIFRDHSPVTPRHMLTCLKSMLQKAGFDKNYYGTHSLRAGWSCDLHKLGLSVESIKKLGRWRSNAVFRYLKNWITLAHHQILFLILDSIPAVHDVWLLCDVFLRDVYQKYLTLKHDTLKSKETAPLYLHEFFNVKEFYKCTSGSPVIARIVNALTEAVNEKDVSLPKYLIVIIDKDLLADFEDHVLSYDDVYLSIVMLTSWLTRQLNTIIRWKRIELLEKKPGALSGFHTKIIFIHMLRRISKMHDDAKISKVYALHPKFNNALNDCAAKLDQYIMTINSCNGYDHFDHCGNLSSKGKKTFWEEIDELIEWFDNGKIKLLPNPKNPPRRKHTHFFNHFRDSGAHNNHRSLPTDVHTRDSTMQRRLPTPPNYANY